MAVEPNAPPPNVALGGRYYTGRGAFLDEGGFPTRRAFHDGILQAIRKTQATGTCDQAMDLDVALERLKAAFVAAGEKGGRILFMGNGGSASIASHMAVDFTKNGAMPALAFNDVAMLTCLANDFGYEQVFERQLAYYARAEDVAVIISSSGRSPNILRSAGAARSAGLSVLATFSGMDPNNRLRAQGDLNFWTPCHDYGLVEIAHLSLLHSLVSL